MVCVTLITVLQHLPKIEYGCSPSLSTAAAEWILSGALWPTPRGIHSLSGTSKHEPGRTGNVSLQPLWPQPRHIFLSSVKTQSHCLVALKGLYN